MIKTIKRLITDQINSKELADVLQLWWTHWKFYEYAKLLLDYYTEDKDWNKVLGNLPDLHPGHRLFKAICNKYPDRDPYLLVTEAYKFHLSKTDFYEVLLKDVENYNGCTIAFINSELGDRFTSPKDNSFWLEEIVPNNYFNLN